MPYTLTDHIGHCSRGCGRKFRVTQEAIDASKDQYNGDVEETVLSFDFCLGCVEGEPVEGEYDIPSTSKPRTSAESQAYIDGVDDDEDEFGVNEERHACTVGDDDEVDEDYDEREARRIEGQEARDLCDHED